MKGVGQRCDRLVQSAVRCYPIVRGIASGRSSAGALSPSTGATGTTTPQQGKAYLMPISLDDEVITLVLCGGGEGYDVCRPWVFTTGKRAACALRRHGQTRRLVWRA